MSLGLTPAGQLRWAPRDGEPVPPEVARLEPAFAADWREALFMLAADRVDTRASPPARFWQQIAERYLTALCHLAEHETRIEVEAPAGADCAAWILAAPPMRGGEYLSEDSLQGVWRHLDAWVGEAVSAAGGLPAFLRARAASWHQVGRVCFHLAENRNDEERPFAFMATFASGFGAAGRVRHLPLRRALEQYAGAKNRAALIALLSPMQQAAEACGWVKELVDSGDVYQPLAWTPDRAYRLLRSVPALEASGLTVRLPNWWRKRSRPQVRVTIGDAAPSMVGADALLDFDVDVALGGEPLSRAELATLLAADGDLVLLKGQWVEVDRDRLRQAIEHWEAVRRDAGDDGISFIEGMRLLAGASADLRHEDETEAERPWVHVDAGDALRGLLADMRRPDALDPVTVGGALEATLRPYQRDGVAWLRLLATLGLGACLADDMGLGKTIQVLALLLCHRGERAPRAAPSLLVIPASLLGNWRREAERFAPSLSLRFLHPAETDREALAEVAEAPSRHLAGVDLAVTTYAMLHRQPWLVDVGWRLVILDEAQAIKNPATRQSRAVRALPARARVALTGTPVENRLGDLWALFDFLNPGLLGSRDVFNRFVKKLQQREEQPFAPLRRLVAPYILRRLKTDRRIIADLPDKTETTRDCHLTRKQVALYQRVVRAMERELERTEGIARRGAVLRSLMRLKQTCNHPSQLSGDGDYRPGDSGKFARLADIGEELAERQERALVFTQFREIIGPLSEHLAAVFGRAGLVLHGGTGVRQRQKLVDRFQRDDGPPFFVISLKAGGTGLNLTAASHVIHFDRWWNPAVENQATDRAFRIGQRRNVLVHRFVTRGTIEERIDRMIAEKRQLADDLLDGGGEIDLTELSDDELIDLVRLDVTRANPQAEA